MTDSWSVLILETGWREHKSTGNLKFIAWKKRILRRIEACNTNLKRTSITSISRSWTAKNFDHVCILVDNFGFAYSAFHSAQFWWVYQSQYPAPLRVSLTIIPWAIGTYVKGGSMPKKNQTFLGQIYRHWENTAPTERTACVAKAIFPPKWARRCAADRMKLAHKEKQGEADQERWKVLWWCWVTCSSSWGSGPCSASCHCVSSSKIYVPATWEFVIA